jgi:quinol monooxygenase YgiN
MRPCQQEAWTVDQGAPNQQESRMPIIIAGEVEFDPDRAEEVLLAAQPVIEEARRKPGYLAYTWSLDPAHPGRAHAFGAWADEAALQSHFDDIYPRMGAVFIGDNNAIRSVNVRKYRFDQTAPVTDETGRLRTDFF